VGQVWFWASHWVMQGAQKVWPQGSCMSSVSRGSASSMQMWLQGTGRVV
jgi:hypothetical protein